MAAQRPIFNRINCKGKRGHGFCRAPYTARSILYGENMITIKVANIIIKLDIPDKFIRDDMYKFQCADSPAGDVLIEMTNNQAHVPNAENGISATVHRVCCFDGNNYYMMSDDDYVTYFQFNNSYSHFTININESAANEDLGEQPEIGVRRAINSALKRIFMMAVADKGGVWLHSSTIMHNSAAICFSASSGTGKTTHTNLWREAFPGVEVINGDMGYMFAKGPQAFFYSAPWSGNSEECMNATAPVKAIVFLEQAKENYIRKLSADEAFMRISTRCFLPAWDKSLYIKAIDTTELLAGIVDSYLLRCLPNESAARVCYHGIY